jgi:hypothetical protein
MSVSSDPHRWLLSYYAALRSRPEVATFAPSIQFQDLVQAIDAEHPSRAATMREWSIAAQHGLLLHLAAMHEQGETAEPFALWQVRKGRAAVALRCGVPTIGRRCPTI